MATKLQSVYDMSLADHGFEAREFRGLTYPLGEHFPAYGDIYPLAPDMGWIRMPVPGPLKHINIWLLDDEDQHGPGFAVADTGLFIPETIAEWKKLLTGPLIDKRMTRIIVTHFHPDHAGCAGWLANRAKVQIWMNRTEWLFFRMLTANPMDAPPEDVVRRRVFQGYDKIQIARFRAQGFGSFSRAVSRMPSGHRRLEDGQHIRIGGRVWEVMTGGGHTPEHSCLIDHHNGAIIAGDQILPRITSNISIMDSEPDSDPLGEWLAGLAKFRKALPADMLVLPAHGEPFRGVHIRLDKLAEGHVERLEILAKALKEKPMRTVDAFPLLFEREIDADNFGMAAGEAQAHFRHLERTGHAKVEDIDGVGWFSAA